MKLCHACNGSGEGLYDKTICYSCAGKGEIVLTDEEEDKEDGLDFWLFWAEQRMIRQENWSREHD